MRVIINGKPKEAPEGTSVLALLQELKLKPDATIVELNHAVLDQKVFGDVTLSEGDRLELVRIVGGG